MPDENQQSDNQQDTEVTEHNDKTAEELQAELDSAINNWKRTAADFDNYRKRKEAENTELVTFAREVTVAKLLPVIDTLGQALRHLPQMNDELRGASGEFGKQFKNWEVGIAGIVMQLDKAMEELGVKRIEAVGKKFDPHLHEAVKEAESDQDDGIIVDELQSGFILNGKVIRPSQVVISRKKQL